MKKNDPFRLILKACLPRGTTIQVDGSWDHYWCRKGKKKVTIWFFEADGSIVIYSKGSRADLNLNDPLILDKLKVLFSKNLVG
jgi:hypothetical protein